MNYDLDKFGLSEEELFSPVDNSSLESEKITAPRYSYWHSVFRVFFKKKINIAVLCLLGVILLMTYVYPLFVEYDRFANLMNGATKLVWFQNFSFPGIYLCAHQPFDWCDCRICLGIFEEG